MKRTYKKLWLMIGLIVVLVGVGYFLYNKYQKSLIPSMVQVDSIRYGLTDIKVPSSAIGEPIGVVKTKISRDEKTRHNLESNFLKLQTPLFESKESKPSPESKIVYKRDGNYYLGQEIVEIKDGILYESEE